ncbi:MAG TPA: hypothetical protein PKA33_10500 [Amaricoccus sp.]|nr:hypothetical protein [Amaricoccus sp.]HMQ92825.1 hypothetical protein [Amaricoccus sp.]HMR52847.1 hypothetical protein [Amaricoccus sp.]HMR60389.1 hypothetical protein [Amaricoccus sp.]HMT99782.1 hypothetical protein [Amaricoccus sp.]
MNAIRPPRGGATVGHVAELDAVAAGAVICLRRWCDGPAAQAQMREDFARALGPEAGGSAMRAFEELCDLCARHGRRPLMRHHVACKCIGADEACFANFVALASEGDREDAMLIATILVRADIAMCLLARAEAFGLALKRMSLRARPAQPPPPTAKILH